MIRDGKRTGHKQGGERGQRKNERWKENRRQTGRKKRTERTMSDGSRKEGGHIGKKRGRRKTDGGRLRVRQVCRARDKDSTT